MKSAVVYCIAPKPDIKLLSLQRCPFCLAWLLEYDGWQKPGNALARAVSELRGGSVRGCYTCSFLVNRLRKQILHSKVSILFAHFISNVRFDLRGTTEAGEKVSLDSDKRPLLIRKTGSSHIVFNC